MCRDRPNPPAIATGKFNALIAIGAGTTPAREVNLASHHVSSSKTSAASSPTLVSSI